MFDSVIQPKGRGRVGTGTLLSVLLHAAALLVALWLSARSGVPVAPPDPVLHFFTSQPHALPSVSLAPSAPAASARPHTARAHTTRAHTARPQPQAVLGARMDPPELASPDMGDAPELDVPGTLGAGVSSLAPTTVSSGPGVGVGSGPVTFSAEQGMTLPRRIAGADPVYTREALEAGVQGNLIAKCVISAEGAVEDCQILKGLPHLNQAVLQALRAQRYTPVTVHGSPVAVSYLFTFRMVLPAR